MKVAIGATERLARMRENVRRFRSRCKDLRPRPSHKRTLALCGYGPSLGRTWRDAEKCDDLMTTSGAHDFMLDRGARPRWHVEWDPREHKVEFVRNSRPGITYCIGSHCHPKMFELLRGRRVIMCHGFTDDDLESQGRLVAELGGAGLISGGTNVGMRAIVIALALGYRHLELHGFDCCYDGETQWAGRHNGERHNVVRVECNGRIFETSDVMMQSTDDFFLNVRPSLGGARVLIHGDGLLEERAKVFAKDPAKALSAGWWRPVDFVVESTP